VGECPDRGGVDFPAKLSRKLGENSSLRMAQASIRGIFRLTSGPAICNGFCQDMRPAVMAHYLAADRLGDICARYPLIDRRRVSELTKKLPAGLGHSNFDNSLFRAVPELLKIPRPRAGALWYSLPELKEGMQHQLEEMTDHQEGWGEIRRLFKHAGA
jgi:hypothetical protein